MVSLATQEEIAALDLRRCALHGQEFEDEGMIGERVPVLVKKQLHNMGPGLYGVPAGAGMFIHGFYVAAPDNAHVYLKGVTAGHPDVYIPCVPQGNGFWVPNVIDQHANVVHMADVVPFLLRELAHDQIGIPNYRYELLNLCVEDGGAAGEAVFAYSINFVTRGVGQVTPAQLQFA